MNWVIYNHASSPHIAGATGGVIFFFSSEFRKFTNFYMKGVCYLVMLDLEYLLEMKSKKVKILNLSKPTNLQVYRREELWYVTFILMSWLIYLLGMLKLEPGTNNRSNKLRKAWERLCHLPHRVVTSEPFQQGTRSRENFNNGMATEVSHLCKL